MNGSPGFPLMYSSPTNSGIFGYVDGVCDPLRVESIWVLVQKRLVERDCDPIRLFIKAEPHTLKKIHEGRFRLIAAVSLVDQIIDHMLNDFLNQREIQKYSSIPSKAGWAPLLGGWRSVPRYWVGYDCTSWDWTVPLWLLKLDLQARFALVMDSPHYDRWVELMIWRFNCLYDKPILQLSNGRRFEQLRPGYLKSGCVNTFSTNSRMQVILHAIASFETDQVPTEIWTAGDDTLQPRNSAEYLEVRKRVCIIKSCSENEFCGHKFMDPFKEPVKYGKHLTSLLYTDRKDLDQALASYQLLYARSSRANEFKSLVARLNPRMIIGREVLLDIYDGD